MIAFARTAEERAAKGDPRPSVAERYKSFNDYHRKVVGAINGLLNDRLMLCEDAAPELDRLVAAGLNAGVPALVGAAPVARFPACEKHARDDHGDGHGDDDDGHGGHGHH
jgi:hypothetical protein